MIYSKNYPQSRQYNVIIFINLLRKMASLKELTEDATTDRQDARSRSIGGRKNYTFHIFYQPSSLIGPHPYLQKMNFKVRDQKNIIGSDVKGGDDRMVNLQFYSLEEELEKTQGLLDLKHGGSQSKSKLVAYCQEERLMDLLQQASRMEIDLTNVPIILAYSNPNSDFANFAGWSDCNLSKLSQMSIANFQDLSKKWIHSAAEKVDLWSVAIKLGEEGRIQKLINGQFKTVQTGPVFQERFLSHLSLGYHVVLSKNYAQKCKDPSKKTTNAFIYGWESFKNFCCLKSSNMRSSTGIVNINYTDEKGQTFEILKHLREYDGSEQSELEASRVVKSDKGILSLLVTNIDRFHGNKLDANINCKPSDGRTEIIVFQGVKKCRRLASVGSSIVLKLQSQQGINLQIGQSIYRLWGCKQLTINQSGKVKISISKQQLEC